MKRSEPTRTKYHTARLRDPGVQKKFSLTLRNRFQTLGNVGDGLENNWNAFRDIIIQTSADVLGTKTRSDKKPDTTKLMNKTRTIKQKKTKCKIRKSYSQIQQRIL